jgi:hypothetical protein
MRKPIQHLRVESVCVTIFLLWRGMCRATTNGELLSGQTLDRLALPGMLKWIGNRFKKSMHAFSLTH